jgi:hypothetical protein
MTPPPGALHRTLDAALMLFALGAALNLASGQAALALLALLLLYGVFRRDPDVRSALSRLGPAGAAATALVLVFAWSSVITQAPFPGWFDATRWRPLVGVVLGGWALAVCGPPTAARVVWVFALGCAGHALVGLYQARTGDAPLAVLLQVPPERWRTPAPDNPSLFSAVGLFYNRVRLSHVLAAGAGVAVAAAVFLQGWRRVVALGAFVTSAAGLFFTYGRAALGALAVTVVLFVTVAALRGAGRVRVQLLAGGFVLLLALGAAGAAVPSVRARMSTALDVSRNQDRLFLWGRGSEMAMDHAPHGTGFGGYGIVRDAYYDRVDPSFESRSMSHHLPLSLLAETGLWGLTAWLWMWWELYRRAWAQRGLAAVCGAMGATTFHAATLAHDPLYQSECALAWALCGALMMAAYRDDAGTPVVLQAQAS